MRASRTGGNRPAVSVCLDPYSRPHHCNTALDHRHDRPRHAFRYAGRDAGGLHEPARRRAEPVRAPARQPRARPDQHPDVCPGPGRLPLARHAGRCGEVRRLSLRVVSLGSGRPDNAFEPLRQATAGGRKRRGMGSHWSRSESDRSRIRTRHAYRAPASRRWAGVACDRQRCPCRGCQRRHFRSGQRCCSHPLAPRQRRRRDGRDRGVNPTGDTLLAQTGSNRSAVAGRQQRLVALRARDRFIPTGTRFEPYRHQSEAFRGHARRRAGKRHHPRQCQRHLHRRPRRRAADQTPAAKRKRVCKQWRRFPQPAFFGPSPNSNLARLQLAETPDGNTWLAGRFGLVRYDPRSDRLTGFRHDPKDPRSLPQTLGEIGYRIFLDDSGVLWIGANLGGLAKLSPQSDRFTHIQDVEPSIISRNLVRAIAEQRTGNGELVWVSNQNAGVTIWRRNSPLDYEIVHRYLPSSEAVPSVGVVRSIAIQPGNGSAWLAGSHALGRIGTPGGPIDLIALEPGLPAPGVPGLRTLHFLDSETLLAGGSRGLWVIDVGTADGPKVVQRYAIPAGIQVFDLLPLDDGSILMAGMGGLVELDPENGETRVLYPAGQSEETPRNDVFHLARDSNGRIWAGTRGAGLLQIDLDGADDPEFRFFGRADGLPDETIYAVLSDSAGSLWLSSNRGVIRYDPGSGRIRQYMPADGLQAWEFNNTVAHVGTSGRYYFGGINGWNVFRPGNVRDLLRPPRVHLKSATVNERPVTLEEDQSPLDLAHDENRIEFDYVGLQFSDPDRIDYAVRLRGLDDKWISVGDSRRAGYASLAPGSYSFEVKAANLDGVWSSPKQLMQFSIGRPPWLTPLAWLLYLAVFFVLVLIVLGYQKQKRRQLRQLVEQRTLQLQQQKELVDKQAGELQQALEARTQLCANVSHEFRTPLTLIRASIEKLEQAPDPEAAALGRKYINRLLRMVEQLLDLSRLRLARTIESDTDWRLDSVVSQTVEAFRSGVEHQRIQIETRVNGAWLTHCPQNLIEKILLNLISNAVKFTPPDGRIKVSLQPAGAGAVICVEDTGPGISEADQAMIFKRFYRARAADANHISGVGIGLALVAEAARTCGGSVDVTSKPGHGTCFWISLPARRPAPGEMVRPARLDLDRQRLDLEALTPGQDSLEPFKAEPGAIAPEDIHGTILVVEDNADLRAYLAQTLAPDWHVEQAVDGIRGFAAAREIFPDIIVTDLMMPDADGFEMLARLRENIETCHIPVLFLTARQDNTTRIKAFTLSADGFLSKPFEIEELKARLAQMMAQRERFRAHLMEHLGAPLKPGEEPRADASGAGGQSSDLAPRDQKLMEGLHEWLEAHSGNSDSEIQAMAESVHLTPRTLQRKLKSLTGRTPAAYLREYRLARARQLLRLSDDSVTDIAHACGFSSSQYFSRAFRDEHGAPPEKWRQDQTHADA